MMTLNASMEEGAVAAAGLQVLAFSIGAEEYGIDIRQVQELRGYGAVTHLATAPGYLKGVIALRGMIVPIVDLRIKLGVATPSYDQFTVVLILDLGTRIVGVVVDSVADVTSIADAQIRPPPCIGAASCSHLRGIASIGERLLMLVDPAAMIDADIDVSALPEAA